MISKIRTAACIGAVAVFCAAQVGATTVTYSDFSSSAGLAINGSVQSVKTTNIGTRFDNGNLWYAWIDYDGTTLEVRTSQTDVRPASANLSYDIDLVTTIGGATSAYVGFTAGTGSAYGNHDIVRWEYRDEFDPITGEIPEPMTMAAVGMAVAGLGGYIRKRRTA